MVNFVLFGHSFVKRLGNKKSFVMTVELERSQVPITCLGEGGLTLDRIQSKPGAYLRQLEKAQHSVLILDLGTNDLCSKDMEPLDFFVSLREFVDTMPSWNIHPDKVVFFQFCRGLEVCQGVR